MKIVILDAGTLGEDVDLSPVYGCGDVTAWTSTSYEELEERIADAEVIMVNKIKLNSDTLRGAKALRLICVTATGYDNIDLDYCKHRAIAVCNVPAYSTDSVSQLTVAMALALVCRLNEYERFVSSGEYSASASANRLSPVYHEISSMTWGILGGGAIGSRVAEVASALGARVLMCRRKADSRYEAVGVDRLCKESDIISLHVPLTDETRGIISKERIALMKRDAILINVARGAVVDEAALVTAIEEGRLGGIGIDVYSAEPFSSEHPYSRILEKSNVILTPHMAWGAKEARDRCVSVIAENIRDFASGGEKNRIV